jgi:ATP-dependent Clp protease ATP-binding subunit ClpC
MFERFTDRARRVVVLAQEEARMLDHNYIGTEHILLGLSHEGEGVAAKALESLGIRLEAVRQQVEEIIGRGQHAPSGHIPFTPRAKKVLELSLREALQLSHNYIGTEHILLGLIREGDGVAARVLVRLGADLNRVRQQVIQLVGTSSGEESAAPSGGETLESAALPRPVPRELWLNEVRTSLASIAERLTAIERHLGLTSRQADPGESPVTPTEPSASSAEPTVASEEAPATAAETSATAGEASGTAAETSGTAGETSGTAGEAAAGSGEGPPDEASGGAKSSA